MGIQDIKGVGPATVKKLNKAGVRTLEDVRGMDVAAIAKKTGLDADRLGEWKTEARMLKVLEDVKGIGPSTKKKLQDAGIHSVDDLARAAIHEVAHATNIAQARLKVWQQEANKLLKQAEGYVKKEAGVVAERTKPAREAAVAKGKEAAVRGRSAAQAAARRGGELANDVKGRVGELRQNGAAAEPAPATQQEAEPTVRVHTTNGSNGANGNAGFLAKIKKIFVKA